jgi:hypothetical protein
LTEFARLGQGWLPNSARAGEAPNVLAFIRRHNNIGLWVGAMVLDRKTDAERAAVCARAAFDSRYKLFFPTGIHT